VSVSLHLVSDLDGTWLPSVGDASDLRALEAFVAAEPGIVLTFATGRSLPSALTVLSALNCALPRHLVTDVGTTIHCRDDGGRWDEDADYARWVDARWDQETAERLALGALPPGVRPQGNVPVRRRLALETREGMDLRQARQELALSLGRVGLVADILASNRRCLDVLPKGVHKGTAIEHLRRKESLPTPLVVCGDSENDLGMLEGADLAVLMADSPLPLDWLGFEERRAVRAAAPGPRGILEVLLALASSAPSGRRGGAG
jgi:HAD superfamily hydrolase (TIGR01484 family)